MTSPEFDQSDPNKQFFDASYEATQLQLAITEKAIGIDALLAAADEEELAIETLIGLSEEELTLFLLQQEQSGIIPEYVGVEIIAVQVSLMIGERVEAPHGYDFLSVGAGELWLNKTTDLGDHISRSKDIVIIGNGQNTDLTQKNNLMDNSLSFKPLSVESVEPEISLDEANSYLMSYLKAAKELLASDPDELKRMIESRIESQGKII